MNSEDMAPESKAGRPAVQATIYARCWTILILVVLAGASYVRC